MASALDSFPASGSWVQFSTCILVIPAIFYLFTELAGYSVNPKISHSARKLTRTPRVIKKKKNLKGAANFT